VAWLSADGAGVVEAFVRPPTAGDDLSSSDVLGVVTFDDGAPDPHLLARVHGHGGWIDWRATALRPT
jgi:hypothetical protein